MVGQTWSNLVKRVKNLYYLVRIVTNEMNIENLIIKLRIEEDNRGSKKKGTHTSTEVKANLRKMVKVPRQRRTTTNGKTLS